MTPSCSRLIIIEGTFLSSVNILYGILRITLLYYNRYYLTALTGFDATVYYAAFS